MLNLISHYFKNNKSIFGSELASETQKHLPVLENIEKHISMLHHRNAQLRKAIIDRSEEGVSKRHDQFVRVLHSYVRLIVMELHGPITQTSRIGENKRYIDIRNETFSGYERLVTRSNLTSTEILNLGSEFARELFQMELQLKRYQRIEQQSIYSLYTQANSRSAPGF